MMVRNNQHPKVDSALQAILSVKQTYKYLYGPVPSRRLGMSPGIELVPRNELFRQSFDHLFQKIIKAEIAVSVAQTNRHQFF